MKLKIREALVVEGRYDRDSLSQVVDAVILETRGFGVFKDKELISLLRFYAGTRGLIVLTDSDGAGFLIRSRIRNAIPPQQLKHAYIPDIPGKERRKAAPSREGKLGVEGMSPQVLLEALQKAGATFEEEDRREDFVGLLSKADFFEMGLSGGAGSREKRKQLALRLGFPERMTSDALLDAVNTMLRCSLLTPEFFDDYRADHADQ